MKIRKINKKNKKGFGFILALLIFIIVGFISLIFFALWKYGINEVNTALISVKTSGNMTNISAIAQDSFSYMNTGLDGLRLVGFAILISYVIGTLIIAYFAKEHPIMFFVYFLITIILVIFSVYVSNVYESMLNNEIVGSVLNNYAESNYVMLNLPYWVIAIGFVGIILGLIGYMRSQG